MYYTTQPLVSNPETGCAHEDTLAHTQRLQTFIMRHTDWMIERLQRDAEELERLNRSSPLGRSHLLHALDQMRRDLLPITDFIGQIAIQSEKVGALKKDYAMPQLMETERECESTRSSATSCIREEGDTFPPPYSGNGSSEELEYMDIEAVRVAAESVASDQGDITLTETVCHSSARVEKMAEGEGWLKGVLIVSQEKIRDWLSGLITEERGRNLSGAAERLSVALLAAAAAAWLRGVLRRLLIVQCVYMARGKSGA